MLKPLETRYQAVVGHDKIKVIYMEESVRNEVIDLLESFTGVVQGCHVTTVHQVRSGKGCDGFIILLSR